MSVTLTARSRAVVALLVAILVSVTWSVARAGGDESDRAPVGPSISGRSNESAEGTDQQEPEIGTALKMVRNADGSVTTTES